MILRPVLVAIPGGESAPRNARIDGQRDAARQALARCAELSGIADREWLKAPDGAPQPTGGWHWSVSHKPNYAAGVVAEVPVGIDVERIQPRNPDLMNEIAGPDEWARIGGRTWDNFFRLWTAKEAVVKANGLGIGHLGGCRLGDVPNADRLTLHFRDRDWTVALRRVDDHLAAVTPADHEITWTLV